jgi:hypothetical protein
VPEEESDKCFDIFSYSSPSLFSSYISFSSLKETRNIKNEESLNTERCTTTMDTRDEGKHQMKYKADVPKELDECFEILSSSFSSFLSFFSSKDTPTPPSQLPTATQPTTISQPINPLPTATPAAHPSNPSKDTASKDG